MKASFANEQYAHHIVLRRGTCLSCLAGPVMTPLGRYMKKAGCARQ
ncbi:hypothetical protein HMPREF9080_02394 [Cardiobacterium valvarum F0432]|uniref:Uncharacterized protein n=1 Tax=Cardiobacterium valvarum F0432 TaxID=797473 RepID=G9ZHY6_9GAMM|nr:hypothetical protein HMPREF9080_02394 [Cardiobacterium valvarum F0432]